MVSRTIKRYENFWEEFTDPDNSETDEHFVKHILPIVTDVGSPWRVNWVDIAKSVSERVREER